MPLYLNPLCKKRSIDFDEELLVIFYSILNYIKTKFGFPVQINIGYELITCEKFKRYLAGFGIRRLKAIKYKYFSDRDLMLWQLCFAFFDKAHKANVVSSGEEYLLAKDFEIVFESMIDELIGDDRIAGLRDKQRVFILCPRVADHFRGCRRSAEEDEESGRILADDGTDAREGRLVVQEEGLGADLVPERGHSAFAAQTHGDEIAH